MQLVVKGKNMEVSDKLRQFVESKIGRLQRTLPDLADVEVELSSAKTRSADSRYVVQVTLTTGGALIRGEQAAADSYSAMDAVLDKLDRQIARFKHKKFGAFNKGATESRGLPRAAVAEPIDEEDAEDEAEGQLVRTKRFLMKPMDVEEALTQMEMLGHDFYVFFNSETEAVNVVYKRRDGNFGLIEPELV